MSTTSFLSIKHANKARDAEEKKKLDRTKGIIVMILEHLFRLGYSETASKLEQESGINLQKYEIADNMDLETIVMVSLNCNELTVNEEFESYYELKFGKSPKYFRKAEVETMPCQQPKRGIKTAPIKQRQEAAKRSIQELRKAQSEKALMKKKTELDVSGKKVAAKEEKQEDFYETRVLKPLPPEMYSSELRGLAMTIQRDIIVQNPGVYWNDIVGLTSAKQLLKEAVVLPVKFPQFFQGLLQPWKGILLFGPPGTGKTMLAKAVATECKTTFFNISASAIVSKWRGDSEKLVRILFELARYHAPSTIFLDELDSIMSHRESQEHEGSRRMKTELLIQMDGLNKSEEHVFVLAASNLPWDLDPAVLRRLEKRILVDLPNENARRLLFKQLLSNRSKDLDYDTLAKLSEGYSGADITLVCKEAAMKPLRKVFSQLEKSLSTKTDEELAKETVSIEPVTMNDVQSALKCTKPSASFNSKKYIKWQELFGANIDVSMSTQF